MSEIFRNVLNASFRGTVVIAAVLLLRLLLKKAPKKYTCLLWILVVVRLLIPVSFESGLSLLPEEPMLTQAEWEALRDYGEIFPPDAPVDHLVEWDPPAVEMTLPPEEASKITVTVTYTPNWAEIAPYLWILGMGILALYGIVSWLRLKRQVREAVRLSGNVWECAGVETAFILGYIRPRIYIPTGLSADSGSYILEHEQTHLKRFDHWVKLVGFIALTVHWFNPAVWLFYILLCRDMEMACDEHVVREMDIARRKAYSAALLECSGNRVHWAACPVAFGEVSVRQRILGVLNYRKQSFWLSAAAVVAVITVAVCFLTDPAEDPSDLWEAEIRAVLEDVQSQDAHGIVEQRRFEGENFRNSSAIFQFFREGDAWLITCHMTGPAGKSSDGYLYLDGRYCEAVTDGGEIVWQPVEQNAEEIPAAWLYTFDIDAQEAKAISRQSADFGYIIRLLVSAPYLDLGDGYYVDFGFDHDGGFRNAVIYAGETAENRITTSTFLYDDPLLDVLGTIEHYAENPGNALSVS